MSASSINYSSFSSKNLVICVDNISCLDLGGYECSCYNICIDIIAGSRERLGQALVIGGTLMLVPLTLSILSIL